MEELLAGPRRRSKTVDPASVSRRQLIGGTVATASFAGACACCEGLINTQSAQAAAWGYSNDYVGPGPELWPDVCGVGGKQSPVNLPRPGGRSTKSAQNRDEISFDPNGVDGIVVSNTGHGTPMLSFKSGTKMQLSGGRGRPKDFKLLQFHFHTPSEHAFDGYRTAMEAHLVHQNVNTGQLAVIGVMLEPGGQSNDCLKVALDLVPKNGEPNVELKYKLNPLKLLPQPDFNGRFPYVHYSGSLTTPPCTEGVQWYVLTKPLQVSDAQILKFMKFAGNGKTYGKNSRPLQQQSDEVQFDITV